MKKIKVRLKHYVDESYQILLQPNLINKLPQDLLKHNFGQKYGIITDSRTHKIHGLELLRLLRLAGLKAEIFSFTPGENAKSLENAIKIAEKLLAADFHRHDCLIALGGGVVGDLTGFIASVYMRGIEYLQIPTTLLAMVDSAIGGKTAINSKRAKNIFGTIHQPDRVYIDSLFLETLPDAEIRNGLAEVIKYGATLNKKLFKYLEKHILDIFKPLKKSPFRLNHKILNKIITLSCRAKVAIIEQDVYENDLRMVLNYGHTFGHAIEQKSHYQIPHGQAISIGICLANQKAVQAKILKEKFALRVKNLLEKTGLPTKLPSNIKLSELTEIMRRDKKNFTSKKITFVFIKKIGKPYISNG